MAKNIVLQRSRKTIEKTTKRLVFLARTVVQLRQAVVQLRQLRICHNIILAVFQSLSLIKRQFCQYSGFLPSKKLKSFKMALSVENRPKHNYPHSMTVTTYFI